MKRILITGANRGIGLELARQCADRGDNVLAGCRFPNNAAINLGKNHLSDVKAEVLLKVFHVNAMGAVLVAQKFVPLLKKGTQPKLINISSEASSISRMNHFRGYNC